MSEEAVKKSSFNQKKWVEITKDAGYIVAAAFLIAIAYHVFILPYGFAPGGVGGIATMVGYLSQQAGVNIPVSVFILIFNLPIHIAVYFVVNKKAAVVITIFIVLNAGFLELMEQTRFLLPKVVTNDAGEKVFELGTKFIEIYTATPIIAALAGGVIAGLGSAVILKRFGALNGTFAISMLIRKKKPTSNPVWVSFIMDCMVVTMSFFVYGRQTDPVLYTFINLFVASKLIDIILTGVKSALKYEIFTDNPQALS